VTIFYFSLTLFIGFLAGFLTCWLIARFALDGLAALFEPIGYKLVNGTWTRPTDPEWKLGDDQKAGV